MENKTFPGSISNLFSSSDIIITNVEKRLTQFTELKSSYTPTFITALRTELTSCEGMPDEAARALWHRQARTNVITTADAGLKLVRALKRYVYTAFPENTNNYYRAMGITEYYASAANSSWDSCRALFSGCNKFIADHLAALTENENMKPEFQETFSQASALFIQKLNIFYQKEELSKTAADERLSACGNFYKKIIACCLDGQYIFEDNETIRKEYSYEAVSEMVSRNTAAGLIVDAERDNEGVMVPMAGVEISIIGTDKAGTTNAEGRTEFTQLPEARLKIKAKADGYHDLILDYDTEAGVTKRLKITMVPLFEGAMTVGADANTAQPAAAPVPANG